MVGPLISPLGAEEEEEGVAAAAAAAAMAPIGESRERKLSHAAGRSTHPAQIWRWGPDGDAGRSGPELDPPAAAATRSTATGRRCLRRRFRPRHWICIGKVDATPPGTVQIEAAAPAPGQPPFPRAGAALRGPRRWLQGRRRQRGQPAEEGRVGQIEPRRGKAASNPPLWTLPWRLHLSPPPAAAAPARNAAAREHPRIHGRIEHDGGRVDES
ncbi:unnamed protein product [Urochloa humidicola]